MGNEELVSLAEYARRNGIDPATVRQRVNRGAYRSARKIGRNWVIDKNEPHVDHRFRAGKNSKGNAALSFAAALEHPDDDDFRSRA